MMEVDCIEQAKLVSIIDQVAQSLNVQDNDCSETFDSLYSIMI
jgi:hypothetical protein